MRVFYQFRKWKAFKVWKDNVRSKKVQNAKRTLEENLFFLHPVSVLKHYWVFGGSHSWRQMTAYTKHIVPRFIHPFVHSFTAAPCGAGAPSPFPLVHLLRYLCFFYFSLSFIGFTYFLLLSVPSLSTRIVPLRFQARGRRKWPNLGLLFCLCYLYSLV